VRLCDGVLCEIDCRCCGVVICSKCSTHRARLMGYEHKAVRVCELCHDDITEALKSEALDLKLMRQQRQVRKQNAKNLRIAQSITASTEKEKDDQHKSCMHS